MESSVLEIQWVWMASTNEQLDISIHWFLSVET